MNLILVGTISLSLVGAISLLVGASWVLVGAMVLALAGASLILVGASSFVRRCGGSLPREALRRVATRESVAAR